MVGIVSTLIGFVPSIVSGIKEYVGKKQDLQKLEREAAVETKRAVLTAQIEQAKSLGVAQIELDKLSVEKTGYGDEFLLIFTTAPLILQLLVSPLLDLYMLPPSTYVAGMLATAMNTGFENLNNLPEYYWYGLGAVYLHYLGMRRMFTALVERMGPGGLFKGK